MNDLPPSTRSDYRIRHEEVLESDASTRIGRTPKMEQTASTPKLHRILVADDDDSVRAVLKRGLEREGYQVDEAEDGEEAWEALNARSYDLLVTDNNMPRLTGTELVFRLRGEGKRLPVLLISGLSPWFEGGLAHALEPGGMMQKPMSFEALHEAVRSLLAEASRSIKTADHP